MDPSVAHPGETLPAAHHSHQLVEEVADLFSNYSGPLLGYALTLTHDPESAQDAVQECFLRYFLARSNGKLIENPRAWLARVLRNHVIDLSRKNAWAADLQSTNAAQRPDPEPDPFTRAREAELSKDLASLLSPRELECVQLRASGLKHREIACALGLSAGTVGVLLGRAARKVRSLLNAGAWLAAGNEWMENECRDLETAAP